MEEQQSAEEKVPLLWAAGEVGKSLSSYFCLFFLGHAVWLMGS